MRRQGEARPLTLIGYCDPSFMGDGDRRSGFSHVANEVRSVGLGGLRAMV